MKYLLEIGFDNGLVITLEFSTNANRTYQQENLYDTDDNIAGMWIPVKGRGRYAFINNPSKITYTKPIDIEVQS